MIKRRCWEEATVPAEYLELQRTLITPTNPHHHHHHYHNLSEEVHHPNALILKPQQLVCKCTLLGQTTKKSLWANGVYFTFRVHNREFSDTEENTSACLFFFFNWVRVYSNKCKCPLVGLIATSQSQTVTSDLLDALKWCYWDLERSSISTLPLWSDEQPRVVEQSSGIVGLGNNSLH